MATPSAQYKLNLRDGARGFIMAFIGAGLTAGLDLLQTGDITAADAKRIGTVGLIAGISYVLKNFFTDGNAVKREVVKEAAVKGFVVPLRDELRPDDDSERAPDWQPYTAYPAGYKVTFNGGIWVAQRSLGEFATGPDAAHPEDWKTL